MRHKDEQIVKVDGNSPLLNASDIQAWIDDDNPRNVDQSAKAQDIRRATAHRAFAHANKLCLAARSKDKERIAALEAGLRRMGVDRMNCRKRVERDGTLNHGPTCRSTVPSERTNRDEWCFVCNAMDLLNPQPPTT